MKVTSYYEYYQHTIIKSGSGTRILLPDVIKELGGTRPVLYSDKGLTNAGITQTIIDLFERVPGIQLAGVFDNIEQDAKSSYINEAISFYKERNGDCLISLGGGSVMDTVKGVKWAIHHKVSDISLAVMGTIAEGRDSRPFATPHVAIPTTAGTGSEVSPGAVILNERLGVKCNIFNPYISADYAILDPDLTLGLPPKITAFTGMDALTHGIEGYFSNKSNAMTDALALQSIRMVIDNLKTAVHEGENLAARSNMLQASSMAILSFCLAVDAVPVHNLAHSFGAKYNIPHGLANAVLLPNVMTHLPELYLDKIQGLAEALRVDDASSDSKTCLKQCIEKIISLRENINLPEDFTEYTIDPEDIPGLIPLVQADPIAMLYKVREDVITKVSKEVIIGTKVKVI